MMCQWNEAVSRMERAQQGVWECNISGVNLQTLNF